MTLVNSRSVLAMASMLAGLSTGACTSTNQAKLSAPDAAGTPAMVLEVHGRRAGEVSARMQNGETCRGQFNTVPMELDTWAEEQQSHPQEEVTQVGMMLLVCPAGLVLRCEFSRDWEGAGSGNCRDQARHRYALVL